MKKDMYILVHFIAAALMAVVVYAYFNIPDLYYYSVIGGVYVLPVILVVWFLAHHNKKGKDYPRNRTHKGGSR